jgi:hypothetical protein
MVALNIAIDQPLTERIKVHQTTPRESLPIFYFAETSPGFKIFITSFHPTKTLLSIYALLRSVKKDISLHAINLEMTRFNRLAVHAMYLNREDAESTKQRVNGQYHDGVTLRVSDGRRNDRVPWHWIKGDIEGSMEIEVRLGREAKEKKRELERLENEKHSGGEGISSQPYPQPADKNLAHSQQPTPASAWCTPSPSFATSGWSTTASTSSVLVEDSLIPPLPKQSTTTNSQAIRVKAKSSLFLPPPVRRNPTKSIYNKATRWVQAWPLHYTS